MDKTGLHTVGVLTLHDGKLITVELLGFDEESGEFVVEIISSSRTHRDRGRVTQTFPIDRIADFDPRPRTAQPWPYSDPCRPGTPTSFARFALMATLFLCMTAGGFLLFLLLARRQYGVQLASMTVYTIFEVWLTFAATQRGQPYMFTCPAVRPQIPRLLRRHLGFLIALVTLETIALTIRPNLPDWWTMPDSKGRVPFEFGVMLLCFGFGLAQVFTNRSLLSRAHLEFSV